jgi:hypothetical protein
MTMRVEAKRSFKVILFTFFVLMLAAPGFSQESRFAFSLKGGYFGPISTTFNKQYLPATNEYLKQLGDYLFDLGLSGVRQNLRKLTGMTDFGGEFEFRAGPQFSIALGAEYIFKKLKTSLELSGNIQESAFDVKQHGQIQMSLLPILATVRIRVPVTGVRVYLGGGAGYYLGRAVLKEDWLWQENLIKVSEGKREIVATKNSLIAHANAGVDLALSEHFYLCGDLRVPFGTLSSFKIKKDTLDQSQVGQNLTFVNLEGQETEFKWELIGPTLTLSLKYKF